MADVPARGTGHTEHSPCPGEAVVASVVDLGPMSSSSYHPSRLGSTVLCLAAVVLLVSCGGSSDPGGASATASSSAQAETTAAAAAGCADVAALESSVQALTGVEPLQDGLTGLEAAVADTKTALDTAVASATAELQPAVEDVRTQFAAVQTAASGVTTDNIKQKAPAIGAALRSLGTATTALASTLTQECPDS
jgi:hypothetical protein